MIKKCPECGICFKYTLDKPRQMYCTIKCERRVRNRREYQKTKFCPYYIEYRKFIQAQRSIRRSNERWIKRTFSPRSPSSHHPWKIGFCTHKMDNI